MHHEIARRGTRGRDKHLKNTNEALAARDFFTMSFQKDESRN
jgi:hypothetical protein